MNVVNFIESLQQEIESNEVSVKVGALEKLAKFIATTPAADINNESVSCLITFYENILTVHYKMLPSILNGIKSLCDYVNFSDFHAVQVVSSLIQLNVQDLEPGVRFDIFRIIERIFKYYPKAMKLVSKSFVQDYILAVDGESSPNCVLLVMKLNKVIAENFNLGHCCEEFFETVTVYFPVQFKTSNHETITREELVEASKLSMIASPLFGPQLFPLLLEKLSSDMKTAIMDSLDILSEGVWKMSYQNLSDYYISFLDCLYSLFRNHDSKCQQLVLRCLDEISKCFEEKADESDLLEFCQHLCQKLDCIVSGSDSKAVEFLLVAIANKSRIWCGVCAIFVPNIISHALTVELKDVEQLEVLTNILKAGSDFPRYQGLMSDSKVKHFFTRAFTLYNQEMFTAETVEEKSHLVALFRLLIQHTLFNIYIPECGFDTNYPHDPNAIIDYRLSLIKIVIGKLAKEPFLNLETALFQLSPALIQSTALLREKNSLFELLFSFCSATGKVQQIGVELLVCFPHSYLDDVLAIIERLIFDSESSKIASIALIGVVDKYSSDQQHFDKFLECFNKIIEKVVVQGILLDGEVTDSIAVALSKLDKSDNSGLKGSLVEKLLSFFRSRAFDITSITWLCAIVGSVSIQTIHKVISTYDILSLLFDLLNNVKDIDLRCLISQTYSSIVNKSTLSSDVEKIICSNVDKLRADVVFILTLLKASIHGSHRLIEAKIIEIITNSGNIRNIFGSELVHYISILFDSSLPKRHFADEKQLIPNRSILYEQRTLHTIARKFQINSSNNELDEFTKDLSMEIFLQMLSNYSKDVIQFSMDEIVSYLLSWLSERNSNSVKISLQISILNAICTFTDKSMKSQLKIDPELIGGIVLSVANNYVNLNWKQKRALSLLITWYASEFSDQNLLDSDIIKRVLKLLSNEGKRIIRNEYVKTKICLF